MTRLQQYHSTQAPRPVQPVAAFPAPVVAPSQPVGVLGQDQISASIAALRQRIGQLQQGIAQVSNQMVSAQPVVAPPVYYPQPVQAPPVYYPQPAPVPGGYPSVATPPFVPAPGAPGIAQAMQTMANDIQRAQWEAQQQSQQMAYQINQVSNQIGQSIHQISTGLQAAAQSFQGIFGKR